jgi:hypothetical protein
MDEGAQLAQGGTTVGWKLLEVFGNGGGFGLHCVCSLRLSSTVSAAMPGQRHPDAFVTANRHWLARLVRRFRLAKRSRKPISSVTSVLSVVNKKGI